MSRKERREAGIQDTYKNLQKAERAFNRVEKDYNIVQNAINDMATNMPDQFNPHCN